LVFFAAMAELRTGEPKADELGPGIVGKCHPCADSLGGCGLAQDFEGKWRPIGGDQVGAELGLVADIAEATPLVLFLHRPKQAGEPVRA
jgi:hypothetical protein